jgi:hypothetical protein
MILRRAQLVIFLFSFSCIYLSYMQIQSPQSTNSSCHPIDRLCSSIIDDLEALAEVRPLSEHEIELKSQLNAQIAGLFREEELKWYQWSKAQFILEGDSNTRYFHSVANGRHRKKRIHSLVHENGLIEGHEQLKSYITNYYKDLFGAPVESSFSLDETQAEDIP